MAQALAIEAKGLVKEFAGRRAVDGIDVAVEAGTIFGLLGPNGAGKTTMLRLLLGIIDPTAGERRLLGWDQPLDAAEEVGYMPEERGLYPAMSCVDAIAFMGALRGLPLREAAAARGRCSPITAWARSPASRSAAFPRGWRKPSSCWGRSSIAPA